MRIGIPASLSSGGAAAAASLRALAASFSACFSARIPARVCLRWDLASCAAWSAFACATAAAVPCGSNTAETFSTASELTITRANGFTTRTRSMPSESGASANFSFESSTRSKLRKSCSSALSIDLKSAITASPVKLICGLPEFGGARANLPVAPTVPCLMVRSVVPLAYGCRACSGNPARSMSTSAAKGSGTTLPLPVSFAVPLIVASNFTGSGCDSSRLALFAVTAREDSSKRATGVTARSS